MMEQIYSDFTTKLLPQIQQGLSITKDYFFDLFGRYVKYLTLIDTIYLIYSIVLLVISIIYLIKVIKWAKSWKSNSTYDSNDRWFAVVGLIAFILLFPVWCIFTYTDNLIKDKYIPEVRVFEEIKGFTNNK